MKLSTLAAVACLTLTHATWALADDLDDFDHYVRKAVADWQVPGLAVAVVRDGKTLFESGYGVLELGTDQPVDEHTLFAIGSTTKAMTAVAVAMLVDEGKLAWSDRVIDHMPKLQLYDLYVTRELRVKDLLTHNAGLPNTDYLWFRQTAELDEILTRMRYAEPNASLRQSYTYQNVMYAAAGRLIELESGLSWFDFIDQRIFRPLEMTRSVPSLAGTADRANVAKPHDLVEQKLAVIENASVDVVAAAGSVWSSVHDMAKWARFLLADCKTANGIPLLEAETCSELFRPQVIVDKEMYPALRLIDHHWLTYGLGWFQIDYRGRKLDFHSGSIDGMVALHGLLRDHGLGVYVLGNRDHAEVRHALMYRALDLFGPRDQSLRDWSRELKDLYDGLAQESAKARQAMLSRRAPDTRPSRALPAYAGHYRDPLYGDLEITSNDGKLELRYGQQLAELEHWEYDTFRFEWKKKWRGGGSVAFTLGPGGKVVAARVNGMTLWRVPDQSWSDPPPR